MTHSPDPSPSRTLLPGLAVLPGHLAWRAHARVIGALDEVLPPGVDLHAYAALLCLAGGATRSQQEIADAVSLSRTTIGRIAADLAGQGLVERVRNPDDRRSYLLSRTPAGAAAARRWRRHAEDVEDRLTVGFSDAEREELRRLLLAVVGDELSPEAPEALLDSIAFLVSRVHARLHRDLLQTLEPVGLEPRHFGTLMALTELGPVPQAELARSLGVSGASVVQIVDDLERRGLVERRRLPADRRTQVLHLRDVVPQVLAEARRRTEETLAVRLRPLGAAETERFTELLARFVVAA